MANNGGVASQMSDAPEDAEPKEERRRSTVKKQTHAELLEMKKDYFEIPHDCWGAGIVVVVKDLADMMAFKAYFFQILRCFFCLGCLFLNLYMQLQVLVWVWTFVIGVSVRTIQDHYKAYHGDVFEKDKTFSNEKWDNFIFQRDMCQAALTQIFFLGAVLFFWTARMIIEFRACDRLFRHFWNLPSLPDDASVDDMVHETHHGGHETNEIVGLNKLTRCFLFLIVLIPKLLICVVLLLLGCRWLTSTESFEDLILNALALEFIVSIDELIFDCFCPARMTKFIEHTKIAIPSTNFSPDEEHKHLVQDYIRSAGFMVFCFGWVYVYLQYIQQVIPGYAGDISHCNAFIEEEFTPMCKLFSDDCFPYGKVSI